jgi:hypothetical protein
MIIFMMILAGALEYSSIKILTYAGVGLIPSCALGLIISIPLASAICKIIDSW